MNSINKCQLIPPIELIIRIVSDSQYRPFCRRVDLLNVASKYHQCQEGREGREGHKRTQSEIHWKAPPDLIHCCIYHPVLIERAIIVWKYSRDDAEYYRNINKELDDYLDFINIETINSDRRRIQQYHSLSTRDRIKWHEVFANNSDMDSGSLESLKSPESPGSPASTGSSQSKKSSCLRSESLNKQEIIDLLDSLKPP